MGDNILAATYVDDSVERDKAVAEAVEKAEERSTRELRAALRRLKMQKDEERQRALAKQKWVSSLVLRYVYVDTCIFFYFVHCYG